MVQDYPFELPESIKTQLDGGIRRSVTHPDFRPGPPRPGELQVFSSLDSVSMALSCLVKTYDEFRFNGKFDSDTLWPHQLALESIIDHLDNIIAWGRVAWPHDPAVLRLLHGTETDDISLGEEPEGSEGGLQ